MLAMFFHHCGAVPFFYFGVCKYGEVHSAHIGFDGIGVFLGENFWFVFWGEITDDLGPVNNTDRLAKTKCSYRFGKLRTDLGTGDEFHGLNVHLNVHFVKSPGMVE